MGLLFEFRAGILVMKRKSLLNKIIISLASCFLALLVFLISVVGWIVANPASAWQYASPYLLPKDLKLTWENVDYQWSWRGWRQWRHTWAAQEFRVKKEVPWVDVTASDVAIEWSFHFWSSEPLLKIEKFKLHLREQAEIKLSPSETEEGAPTQNPYQRVKGILGYFSKPQTKILVIQNIDIQTESINIYLADQSLWQCQVQVTTHGMTSTIPQQGATIMETSAEDSHEWRFSAGATAKDLDMALSGSFKPDNIESENPFLRINTQVKASQWSIKGSWSGNFKDEVLNLYGDPAIEVKGEKEKWVTATNKITLKLSSEAMNVRGRSGVVGVPGPIMSLDQVESEVDIPLVPDRMWATEASTIKIEAPVDIFLVDKNMRPPLEKACRCRLPEKFLISLGAKVWLEQLLAEKTTEGETGEKAEREKVAEAQLKMESIKNALFSADLALAADVFKEKAELRIYPQTKTKLVVHSFQGLRQFLDAKGIMIPAPLDVLEGSLELIANNPIERHTEKTTTVVELKTDLKSKKQTVQTTTLAQVDLWNTLQRIDVDLEATIHKLILETPPLDPVLGIPSLASDARILRQPVKKNTKPGVVIKIATRLKTETKGAIQLLNPYAEPYVPISLFLKTKGEKALGSLHVEPFSVNYLRRHIQVEGVQVDLVDSDEAEMPLRGRMRIEQGGYTLFINLSGTAQAPQIHFSSEPSLTENDIISVLLYGRVSTQLVSAEAETAGNFNAALADRAVGLLGLWIFASTPIQSFSYNATTKVYTATVNLGDGLSAGVGTNWEQATNFELRKRLSRRWVLTAVWSPAISNSGRQEGRLVLQWEKRF